MDNICRHGKDEFPNADKVTLVDDAAFLEQTARRGESIQSIVATSEVSHPTPTPTMSSIRTH